MAEPTLSLAAHEPSPGDGPGKAAPEVRCRFAHGSDPGPRLTDDISRQLRTRLRMGVLIILAGFALHLLRNVLQGPAIDHRLLLLVFTSGEVAAPAAASAP